VRFVEWPRQKLVCRNLYGCRNITVGHIVSRLFIRDPVFGGKQPMISPPRKGYPLAAKVYQQDELSPPNKDALFAANEVRAAKAGLAANVMEIRSFAALKKVITRLLPDKKSQGCASGAVSR
jgi:hypothetical protein